MMFNYYQKSLLSKYLTILLMLFLLVANLFPIFWMIFCSFKNNTDILSGNIGFSRTLTDVKAIVADSREFYVVAIDGGLSKFRLEDKKLLDYVSIKGQNISYTYDRNFFYLAKSNAGITKIKKNGLKKSKNISIRSEISGVDLNKIGNTSIVNDDKYLYFTLENRGFSRILIYDKNNLQLQKAIRLDIIGKRDYIRSLHLNGDYLYVGTNKDFVKINKNTFNIEKKISFGGDYYPSGVQKVIGYDNDLVEVLTHKAIYSFDLNSEKIVSKRSYGLSYLEDAYVEGDLLYISHSGGLTVVDSKQDIVNVTYKNTISEMNDKYKIADKAEFNISELTSVTKIDDEIILGSTYGRMSVLNQNSIVPNRAWQLKPGYVLFKWQNYVDLWKNIDFGLYLKNSILISGLTMIFAMIMATFTAYALVRFDFPGNKSFGIAILATQMIPAIMYLIPLFSMFKWITDTTSVPVNGTYYGLIFIYTAFFVPFSIWILRSFFAAIPRELEESARIDGCNGFEVFYKIVLPLAIPGIIATGIYIFLVAWDELIFAWVLTSADTMTIPIGIRLFVGNFQNRYDLMMAAATVATVPVIILFFMLQKHIVKGLTAGAVKG